MTETSNSYMFCNCTQSFIEKGYVVFKQLLDSDHVDLIWEKAKSLIAIEVTRTDPHPYHAVIFSIHQLSVKHPAFKPFITLPETAEIASILLGGQVRVLLDQLICKPTGARPTIPHQDAPFLPLGEQPTVNCWIPLSNVNTENGALIYYEGSHRLPILPLVHLDGEPEQLNPDKEGLTGRSIPMSVGDCVFHDGRIVHAASGNSSGNHRYAISVQYMKEGALAHKPIHPFMQEIGIYPGVHMTHDCFPRPRILRKLPISEQLK